jgi:hypothetical protein
MMPESHEIDPAVRWFGVFALLFTAVCMVLCLALPVAVFWIAFG